jgi:hypothetical protein
MPIYSYHNYDMAPSCVVRVEAESILLADSMVRAKGFNPLNLSCSIGVRYVCFNYNLVERVNLNKSAIYPSQMDFLYRGGDLFVSPIYTDRQVAVSAFKNNPSMRTLVFTDLLFEYPCMNQHHLRVSVGNLKEYV